MFIRQQIWQDAIIHSRSESGWENTITFAYPCVDIRFKLKGYGWKPEDAITNLTILYEGRYDCYYREKGVTQWVYFTTVISERASYEITKVYEDSVAWLGVVASKIYEIKIVARDAEKFKNWGGIIEGIAEGGRFYSNLQFRANRPFSIQSFESIVVTEYSYGGHQVFGLFSSDEVLINESFLPSLIHLINLVDVVTIEEIFRGYLPIYFSYMEVINLMESLDIKLNYNLNAGFEGLFVTEEVTVAI